MAGRESGVLLRKTNTPPVFPRPLFNRKETQPKRPLSPPTQAMDVLSALMLMAFGLLLLWILVIRKRLAASPDDERLSLAVDTSTEKASSDPHDGGVMYTYSAAWTTGRRRYMEDRYIACPVHLHVAARSSSNNGKHRNGRNTQEKFASLYGVFDGHGGARAADFCRDNMRSLFEEAAMEVGEEYRRSGCIGDGDDDGDVDDSSDARVAAVALRRAMETLDTEFMKRAKAENLADGTTAVVALTHGDQVVVGNIGTCVRTDFISFHAMVLELAGTTFSCLSFGCASCHETDFRRLASCSRHDRG